MKKRTRLLLVGFLAALVGAAYLLLRSPLAWEAACSGARKYLPRALSMDVAIGRCEVDPIRRMVRLYDVTATPPGQTRAAPVFEVQSAEIQVGGFHPLWGALALDRVVLTRPVLRVSRAEGKKRKEESSGCALGALKRLSVSELSLEGGELQMELPEGAQVQLSGISITSRGNRSKSDFKASVKEGAWKQTGATWPIERLSASFSLAAAEEQAEISGIELQMADAALSLSGKVDQLCDPSLSIQGQLFVSAATAARMAGSSTEASGNLWVGLLASGKASSPQLSLEVAATQLELGAQRPGDVRGRVTLSEEAVAVHELSLDFGKGKLRAKGSVQPGADHPFTFRIDAEGAELGPLLAKAGLTGSWVNFPISGKVTGKGQLFPKFAVSADADLAIERFWLGTRAFDALSPGPAFLTFPQGRVVASVRVKPDRVELPRFEASSGKSRAAGDATFFFDKDKGMAIRAKAESLDMSDFRRLGELAFAGEGTGPFEVVGPYEDLKISADLAMKDLEVGPFALGSASGKLTYGGRLLRIAPVSGQRGKTSYTTSMEMTFTRQSTRARLELDLPNGRAQDVLEAVAKLHPTLAFLRPYLGGELSGHLLLDGPMVDWKGELEVTGQKLLLLERPMGQGQMKIHFDGARRTVLERLAVKGPVGQLSSSGDLANREGRRLRFSAKDVRLGELTPLSGALDVDGKLLGDDWSGQAKSEEISWNGRSLGPLALSARQEGEALLVSGQLFSGAGMKMSVGMQEGLPYSADVSLAVKELALGSALGESLLVTASGKALSSGRLSDWSTSRGKLELSSLALSRKDFQVDSAGPFALSFDAGRLSMDAVTFKGPNTQLSMQGWLGPKALDVKVRGSADVRLLESFVPSMQRTAGRVDLSATASGPLSEASLFGSAALKDVRFLVRDHPLSVRQLSGDVEFTEARLLVRNGQGILNEGRFEVGGDLRLDHFEPQAVNLSAQFRDVAYRLSDEFPLTASGELSLKGPVSSLDLGGEVNVQKLRYEKPFSLDSLMRGGQVPRFSRASEAPGKEWVKLDVGVTLGDVKVENNLAQAKLMGKLRLVGTNARMGVLGTLESGPGSQAFFRNNRFTIGHGLVQFTDRNSIQAGFDIQAETQVREYLVRLHAYGEVQKPKFTLTSQPELSENDILSLLTLGMTSKDKVSSAQASAGLAAEALFAASGLDRQFQRFLPKNPVLRDFSFNIGTSYNDATGVVEPAAQLESKFLTEQLRLQMARPVSGKGTRAKAEYRFDNGLSAQAQWDNEHTDASFGNLGMDLKLRWEVE